jgi:hypothetical protein
MKISKVFLHIVSAALIGVMLAGCGGAPLETATAPAPSGDAIDFSGHWEDASTGFTLDLVQDINQLKGGHSVVAQGGNKIDSLPDSIKGSIDGNVATVQFQSSFAAQPGTALLLFVDANTIGWKITAAPEGEFYLPAEATLVKKSAEAPAATGVIAGQVYLMAPPTPAMVVYAVDPTTGQWGFTETPENPDGPADFSISVPPGSYQVYAFGLAGGYTGYSEDGFSLAVVNVAANQTVSGIKVGPPGNSDCGALFGVPGSPDGRFPAVAGPSADCVASLQAEPTPTVAPAGETVRIQFSPGATSWQTPGDLDAEETIRFVLNAMKGQVLSVILTTEPADVGGPPAYLYIVGADGQVLTPEVTLNYQGALTTSQDYYIEIRSLYSSPILYNLVVAIPAVGTTPYVPVTPSVCQTLQELAAQALGVNFTMEASVPFQDPITGESGQACRLTTSGTGEFFSSPSDVLSSLVNGFMGFTEAPAYRADGPTGSATAVTRDLALVLISANWAPAPGVQCPSDKPISECDLQPEQQVYTILIQAAMK